MAETPKLTFTTGNAVIDGLILKGIVALAGIAATWLYQHLKLTDPNYVTYLSGTIVTVLIMAAAAIYGVIATQVHRAQGVTAGMNLAVSGNMRRLATGVPAPVTPASAAQIVKDYAPPPAVAAAP